VPQQAGSRRLSQTLGASKVAYAHCPNCLKSFRYQLEATEGPAWLKDLARSVGKGEQAVLLCSKCWVVPEVGDEVEVTQPSEDEPHLRVGAVGQVVQVWGEDSAYPIFLVEGLSSEGSPAWSARLMRWQIRAHKAPVEGTLRFRLTPPSDQNQK